MQDFDFNELARLKDGNKKIDIIPNDFFSSVYKQLKGGAKVFCGIGDIPKGQKLGNMKECAELGKIAHWGLHKVDKKIEQLALESKEKNKTPAKLEKELDAKKLLFASLTGKISKIKKDIPYEKTKKAQKELTLKQKELEAERDILKKSMQELKARWEKKKDTVKEKPKKKIVEVEEEEEEEEKPKKKKVSKKKIVEEEEIKPKKKVSKKESTKKDTKKRSKQKILDEMYHMEDLIDSLKKKGETTEDEEEELENIKEELNKNYPNWAFEK